MHIAVLFSGQLLVEEIELRRFGGFLQLLRGVQPQFRVGSQQFALGGVGRVLVEAVGADVAAAALGQGKRQRQFAVFHHERQVTVYQLFLQGHGGRAHHQLAAPAFGHDAAGNQVGHAFADPGRAYHQDVFRGHFMAHLFAELHPAPAVAQGHGHRTLGIGLTDDVSVQLVDDFSRGHLGHDGVPVSGAGRAHPLENELADGRPYLAL